MTTQRTTRETTHERIEMTHAHLRMRWQRPRPGPPAVGTGGPRVMPWLTPGLVVALVVVSLAAPGRAQEYFRLASAQVVAFADQASVLRLTANGPVAFERLPADAGPVAEGSAEVRVRLFGVLPGELARTDDLSPFAVSVLSVDGGAEVTVQALGLQPGATLVVSTGQSIRELEFRVVAP
ncbi:MAG: hypothetical protein HOP14_03375 [Acidobacteria bacterium]|nr:hypothetical protein [Acidobacteriota bacterium]